ncbi:MAG: phage portal protein [Acidimicrobiales bacterium]
MSISDPATAEYFQVGTSNYSGVVVGESAALGISAVYRAIALISGSIASLPGHVVRTHDDGTKERVDSWLDDPGFMQTRYEFWETVLTHLLLHGNAFLLHIHGGAGQIVSMQIVHPLSVSVKLDSAMNKVYEVTLDNGTKQAFDDLTMTHIPALSTDGLRGLSPITVARNSLGIAVAGDRAAARMFSNGPLIAGMVTPEDDLSEDDAKAIKAGLDAKVAGYENAGQIPVINRKLKFTPWTMSNEDAQFLQSRQFQIEEIARWYGVPPYELMQTEKQTSWGTGIEAQQRGLARQVLGPWAVRVEQRITRLLPDGDKFEFDFSGLERPTPAEEIALLIQQVQGGLLTVNEARRVRNMPPIEGGDALASNPVGGPNV